MTPSEMSRMYDENLESMLQNAESEVLGYLRANYPIGCTVSFDWGRSELVGTVIEYGALGLHFGSLCVRVFKRGGDGSYLKWVSPSFSGHNCRVVQRVPAIRAFSVNGCITKGHSHE